MQRNLTILAVLQIIKIETGLSNLTINFSISFFPHYENAKPIFSIIREDDLLIPTKLLLDFVLDACFLDLITILNLQIKVKLCPPLSQISLQKAINLTDN